MFWHRTHHKSVHFFPASQAFAKFAEYIYLLIQKNLPLFLVLPLWLLTLLLSIIFSLFWFLSLLLLLLRLRLLLLPRGIISGHLISFFVSSLLVSTQAALVSSKPFSACFFKLSANFLFLLSNSQSWTKCPYLLHLEQQLPIILLSFIYWTLSDNLEWDGM